MLAADGLVALELGAAAALLLLVVWTARVLLLSRRWRELIDALHRVADALEALEVVIVADDDEKNSEQG